MILQGLPSTITKKLFILKELGLFLGFFWRFWRFCVLSRGLVIVVRIANLYLSCPSSHEILSIDSRLGALANGRDPKHAGACLGEDSPLRGEPRPYDRRLLAPPTEAVRQSRKRRSAGVPSPAIAALKEKARTFWGSGAEVLR